MVELCYPYDVIFNISFYCVMSLRFNLILPSLLQHLLCNLLCLLFLKLFMQRSPTTRFTMTEIHLLFLGHYVFCYPIFLYCVSFFIVLHLIDFNEEHFCHLNFLMVYQVLQLKFGQLCTSMDPSIDFHCDLDYELNQKHFQNFLPIHNSL